MPYKIPNTFIIVQNLFKLKNVLEQIIVLCQLIIDLRFSVYNASRVKIGQMLNKFF